MPVKRRQAKRRTSPAAELEAWDIVFYGGCDFFGDLEEFGIEDRDAVRAAMPDAWARLGRMYLDRLDRRAYPDTPSALKQFGEPETCL